MEKDQPIFRARTDMGIKVISTLVFSGLVIAILYYVFYKQWIDSIIYLIFLLVQIIFTIGKLRTTFYRFDHDELYCQSMLTKRRILYSSIQKIEKRPESAFAARRALHMSLSLNGPMIHCDNFGNICISPENEDEFIALLKERNPGIVVT